MYLTFRSSDSLKRFLDCLVSNVPDVIVDTKPQAPASGVVSASACRSPPVSAPAGEVTGDVVHAMEESIVLVDAVGMNDDDVEHGDWDIV